MKAVVSLLIITTLSTGLLLGQDLTREQLPSDALSRLEYYAANGAALSLYSDSLIVSNYYKLYQKNRHITGVPGYRIRIFTDSGLGAKENQKKERARFLSLYPDIDAYYKYDQPDFKVYVGNCRTRSEAVKLYERIKGNYSDALIVPDMIYIEGLE
ncbi:MAG: hypothetical protein ACOYXB_02655 [Bacteroidota bacterium]